jgi:ATP-binding protein involved in chromosome partitioning
MDLVAALRSRLAEVRDPELNASIVELGMVGTIEVDPGGHARIAVALTTASCPLRGTIEREVRAAAESLEGVTSVELLMGVLDADAKSELMRTARRLAQANAPLTSVPRSAPVVMIASGKGGVGKSSLTANLAVALARMGRRVGVLDADIWGFSLARLLNIHGDIAVRGGKMLPLVRPEGSGSVALLSMGHLADDDQALLWRGLMVQKAVAQFIEDADWSGIDILLIDTPPGTGDIVMTLAKLLPHLGQIVVTTPAMAAQQVAARAADFAQKSNLRILGVVENMTGFDCACGTRHAPFGAGGGEHLAQRLGVPLLAAIPLIDDVAQGGDSGTPVASTETTHGVFAQLATSVSEVSATLIPAGCTARLLDSLDQAVREVEAS